MGETLAQARFALEQWGIWCRTQTGAPRDAISWMGPFVDRLKERRGEPDDRPVRTWEDRDCEAFDLHVMAHIRSTNYDAFRALVLYYAFPGDDEYRALSKAVLAKRLGVNRDTATKRLEIGENMVAAMVAMAA